jgi:hypothetical protein
MWSGITIGRGEFVRRYAKCREVCLVSRTRITWPVEIRVVASAEAWKI